MIDQGIDVETPTRELVAKWVVGTYSRLDDEGKARQKLANTLRTIRAADREEALQWMTRRDLLATHLDYCKHNI